MATITMQGCIDLANGILMSNNKIKDNEKVHLAELAKMHITFTIATINGGKLTIEKLINSINYNEFDKQIEKCIEEIHHQLVMIESRLEGCKLVGINCDDTTVINECTFGLLNDYFKHLEKLTSIHTKTPFISINKVFDDYNRLRPIIYHKSYISLKSDRNENFLGTPGPNYVYKIGGITELTTSKFGDYAKFTMIKIRSGNDLLPVSDDQFIAIKYGDEIVLAIDKWGNLRHYISGTFQRSWWEYNSQINDRAIFKIVHPIDANITREIRFGDRVCLLLKISIQNNWRNKYLSGKLFSRVLKLSSSPHTWTLYNSDGILPKL
jgi:hypothetical protein